jgi:hypothetical protein
MNWILSSARASPLTGNTAVPVLSCLADTILPWVLSLAWPLLELELGRGEGDFGEESLAQPALESWDCCSIL